MRFEIARTVPDPERVKATCRSVAKAARISATGLLVRVEKYHHGATSGRCYGDACGVRRGGKWIACNGYIKLRFQDWRQLAQTFAHELSHLRDARSPRIRWGRERRARAFANKVIASMQQKEEKP